MLMLQSLSINICLFWPWMKTYPTPTTHFFIYFWQLWLIWYYVQQFTRIGKDREEREANNCTLLLVERDTTLLHTKRKLNSLLPKRVLVSFRQNTRREMLLYKLQKENTELKWLALTEFGNVIAWCIWHVTRRVGRGDITVYLTSPLPHPALLLFGIQYICLALSSWK